MKKVFLIFCGVLFVSPAAMAGEIRNVITDSVQLTVNGSASQTTRQASSYSVSGSNVTATTLGGLGAGTAGSGMAISDGSYAVSTAGQAFTFSESGIVGEDTLDSMEIDATTNLLDTHNTYGELTTTTGGTKGTLAGSLNNTAVPTITAGGQGTTAIGQRTVTLSVFK